MEPATTVTQCCARMSGGQASHVPFASLYSTETLALVDCSVVTATLVAVVAEAGPRCTREQVTCFVEATGVSGSNDSDGKVGSAGTSSFRSTGTFAASKIRFVSTVSIRQETQLEEYDDEGGVAEIR